MCPDPECHDPCFEGPFLLALHAFHERSLMSGAKRFCEAVQLDKWVEKRKVNRKNKWNLVKDKRKPRREKSGNHSRNIKPDSPIRMTTASTSQNLQRRAQTTLSVKLQGTPLFLVSFLLVLSINKGTSIASYEALSTQSIHTAPPPLLFSLAQGRRGGVDGKQTQAV